jgi:hypothetical protein
VGRRSRGRWFRWLGTGGMCSWGSLAGYRRAQGMYLGVRVNFKEG